MSGPTLTLVAEEPSSASKYPEADEDAPSGSAKTRVSLPAAQSNPFMASAEETAELFNSIDQDLDLAEASSQPQQHPEAESESESEDDRDEEEIEGVAWEMRQLEHKFEGLKEAYQLVDRLGEGEPSWAHTYTS